MAGSFVRARFHMVWSTRGRAPSLDSSWRPRLWGYMNKVVQDHGGILFDAGGVSDHVHLYLECPKDVSVSSLASLIKTSSTNWIRGTFRSSQRFHWQSGYSAFSVDARNDRRLREYIRNQEFHHAKVPFDREYKRFLEEYAIDHDDRYVLG